MPVLASRLDRRAETYLTDAAMRARSSEVAGARAFGVFRM